MQKTAHIVSTMVAIVWLGMAVACKSSTKNTQELTVFCCAGLTEVLTDMSNSFMQKHPVSIRLNFASSGTLARQLKNGAPADVYLSASNEWMTYCRENMLIDTASVAPFLTNRLVWICPSNTQKKEEFVPGKIEANKKIAIGDPSHVPAGNYAKNYLQTAGLWKQLEPQLIPCRDVKNTLFMVEHGEVDLGIVYLSDAVRSSKVTLLEVIPDSTHIPIQLSMAMVKTSAVAADFFAFLTNDSNQIHYKKYGFTPIAK